MEHHSMIPSPKLEMLLCGGVVAVVVLGGEEGGPGTWSVYPEHV